MHVGLATVLELAALGLFAGWLGAVVGIGGGVVVVPALVLGFGLGTRVAVAASLVAVVATSVAAGSTYVGAGQTNIRLALTLEIATATGGLLGGVVAVLVAPTVIDCVFAVMMLATAALMIRRREQHSGANAPAAPAGTAASLVASGARIAWEERGHLGGAYHDSSEDRLVVYRAVRLWIGWTASLVAGLLSGLLGVGGGFVKVPAMTLGMKIPIKVSTATSNFMIGITAVASLFIYFSRGDVLPFVAAPIALGIATGASAGAKSAHRFSPRTLGRILAVVLCVVAVEMALKAFGVSDA